VSASLPAVIGLVLGAVATALMKLWTEPLDPGRAPKTAPEREAARLSAVTVLDRETRLALLGDPGAGKSTFVNFVALCLAGEALGRADANLALMTTPLPAEGPERSEEPQPQPWRHGALLPVRVMLRDFATRGLPAAGKPANGDHLWRFIVAELGESLAEYAPHLKRELHERGGLVLLDGLDEVPEADQRRVQVKQAVTGFAADFPACRFVVTSRTYAYQRQDWKLPGFAEAALAPFSPGQITRFVDGWYAHLAAVRGMNPDDARGRAVLLKEAIRRSDRLAELAERPLLLTLMASLHAWRGGNLPEKREALYADTVDLLLDQWESPKLVRGPDGQPVVPEPSLSEWMKVDKSAVRKLLERLAFEAHRDQPALTGTADIPQDHLVTGLVQLTANPDVKPARVIEYVRDRAGLLAARGEGVYTFPHRTFQEYLAACYLTDHGFPDDLTQLVLADGQRWREAALLAGAKAASGTISAAWNLAEALCCRQVSARPEGGVYLAALLAAQTLIENGALAAVSDRNRPKSECIHGWLRAIAERGALSPVDRAAAGDALAVMGDDRPGVGLTPDGLPDIAWCDVPAGEFVMGSVNDELAVYGGKETPQHRLKLEAFRISKHPITVVQFSAFARAGGYAEPRYWRQAREAGRWRKGKINLYRWDPESQTVREEWFEKPSDPGAPFNLDNHPMMEVSWYEAQAFCLWLSEKLGYDVSLPSEAQWEKAARGPSTGTGGGRTYPWGEEITPEHANYYETGIGTTSAVGIFPLGASPYGALDMSGNVWEWTRSLWGEDWQKSRYNYPYDATDGRENLDAPDSVLRVLRGGAFYDLAWLVRCAFRNWNDPFDRFRPNGFRVVASPIIHDSGS
jgi:formylglycine-generating enzyme required for sulfatase activity